MKFAPVLCFLLLSAPASAQPEANVLTIRLGETTERLTAASDTTQHYALYLPSTYSAERPAPILFLMDPRGRALLPLDLFRDAAERLGYVVMSSYETLSDADSAFTVNGRALDAMIQDAQLRFTVAPSRLYLSGFSGTSHFIWTVAPALDGHLAGFIGVGDGMPPDEPTVRATMRMERPPAYFGIAGNRDFNYDAAWQRHRGLDASSLPHRFASFDGPHAWPPKPLAEEALTWLELHAVRTGLAERPATWVDSLYTAHLTEAQTLDRDGRLTEAFQRYEEIARDFEGLRSTETITARAAELADDRTVKRAYRRRDALARRVNEYKVRIHTFADDYRRSDLLIPHDRGLRRLDIPRLLRETENDDPTEAAAAHRMLASAFARLGFYEPRDYMSSKDYARAAGALRLAHEINPAGFLCYRLARAEAQLGNEEAALDALACTIEKRGVRPETLRTDALLNPIRPTARFAELTEPYLRTSVPPED